ncbi:MAG: DNA polymerase III subunit alpha [Gemmataceae bacterium]
MAKCFCHLHLHTHYSLLDGFNRIPPLVTQTKKLGMNACAITDHGNLYGAIEFYNECTKGGIKPIIGYEAYLAPGSRTDRKAANQDKAYSHLTLLAKNATGFRNLVKLSSIAFLEGFYYHPRIDREILEQHKEGLICLSGCLAGEFNQNILKDQVPEAEKLAKWFAKVFGEDYYIELQNNGIALQDQCTPVAADIANKLGIPLVATADAHYLCASDALAHDVLFCINTRRKHDPRKRLYPEEKMPNPYFVRSPEEMYKLFPDYEDAVARSQEIADKVDIQLDFKKRHFPVFTPPPGRTPEQFLRELCEIGIKERYGDNPSEAVLKRLELELGVITKMGFASYFLIVWDFVRFARESGIPCTARGSGCGAIVAYVLYLSHVCPLEYDLLFERFLDPNRSEAPDIDIDFCQDRRELVIDYVKRKYGVESVAQIGTFGTLAAKNAMKDVGRALDVPLDRVNMMCKLVPMKGAISADLSEAMASPDFKREYDADPQIREMVDIAMKLEGMNRNVGTHAAGVVIANGPITDYVPVQRIVRKADGEDGDNGKGTIAVTTQWEMGIIEKVGMLKMDFLGLRNLTVLDNCVRLIKKTRGQDIDPHKFPLDDPETYKLLQRGDAKGVFQLESEGMRELLKRMRPDNIRDLIAVLALYRPGPLEGGMVDEYIECKHGRRQPVYPHPVMEEVLSETYAVMVYQEQIMRILNRLGGIELAKAYACIKAISKKKQEIIDERKADFIKGCADRGLTTEKAEEIFELIVKFGGYGFNKCVAADTEVTDAETGELVTVGELFDTSRRIAVHALGDDGKLRVRPVSDVVWNGRKRVYRLTTELGKQIVATSNHPFRTLDGWTNLGDLKVGDRIAASRRVPVPTAKTWPQHEIIALAGLLSEGNTCHPSTLYFYGNDRVLVEDFANAIGRFPDTVAKVHARKGGRRLEVRANTGRDWRFQAKTAWNATAVVAPTRSGAFTWASGLGILGKKATEKVVPAAVFTLCDSDLELFLGRLWAGDGFIANDSLKVPFYATSSRRLASDVQHLLLRLGIVSRIHNKQFKYKDGLRPGYTVHILGDGAAEMFLERIAPHCLGRERAVGILKNHLLTTLRGLSSKDTVPLGVRAWVDEERRRCNLTWDELELQSDVSTQEFYGTPSAGRRGSGGERLQSSRSSSSLANSERSHVRLLGSRQSVELLGVQDTYDLTVEEDHNFVANGLVVHNSHGRVCGLVTRPRI